MDAVLWAATAQIFSKRVPKPYRRNLRPVSVPDTLHRAIDFARSGQVGPIGALVIRLDDGTEYVGRDIIALAERADRPEHD